jgi:hypothetical protein
MGIVDARIHESGLVALTGSLSLLEIKGWEGGKPLTLTSPGQLNVDILSAMSLNTPQVLRSHLTHGQSFHRTSLFPGMSKYCSP